MVETDNGYMSREVYWDMSREGYGGVKFEKQSVEQEWL